MPLSFDDYYQADRACAAQWVACEPKVEAVEEPSETNEEETSWFFATLKKCFPNGERIG